MRRDKSGHRKNSTERGALTYWTWHGERQVRTRERIRPSQRHSQTGDRIGRHKSGYGKNTTERGALTFWRRDREGQVRTRKESDQVRGTHMLETALGGTCQDAERIRPSEGHSLSGDGVRRDKSAHGRDQTKRGELTPWGRHREGQVRTQKKSDQVRGTHILETASGGTSQHTEKIRASEGHSLPRDSIGWDKSGHRKNPTQRAALTFWRRHQEGQVSTRKEPDRARGTHTLETASGGTSQDRERI